MTVLKVIGMIVVLAVVVVLVLAARKPDHFRVQRSASIAAPPERIFPLINDFHRWGAWSPYEHKDRMVGTDFEAGLANLTTAAEHEPAGSPS